MVTKRKARQKDASPFRVYELLIADTTNAPSPVNSNVPLTSAPTVAVILARLQMAEPLRNFSPSVAPCRMKLKDTFVPMRLDASVKLSELSTRRVQLTFHDLMPAMCPFQSPEPGYDTS